MKIKNMKLMLLGLLAMGSINVFGAVGDKKLYDGIRYQVTAETAEKDGSTAAKAIEVKVYGAVTAATTLSVPASFSLTGENGIVKYFNVVGFLDTWASAADVTDAQTARKKVSETLTSLTIDATNMSVLDYYAEGMTKLATLTLSSTNAAHTSSTTLTNCTGVNVQATLTTLDLSGCTKMTGIADNAFKVAAGVYDKLTTITLPAALTTIGAYAFQGTKATALTIPATVATIGKWAFAQAEITSIDLSATAVKEIPAAAFYKSKLATITLPENLTTIETAAFQEAALTAITIPAKVKTIEHDAFYKCESLASADLSAAADLTLIDSKTFFGAKALTAITIPAKVATIGPSAFEGCEALATVTISGDKLATIGASAFKDAGLTAFVVPASVTTIGASAFEGCESLATVTLNTTDLASIGNAAFKGAAITAFTLPATKAATFTYGDNVFEGCEALTTFTAAKDSKLATLGTKGFTGCKSLASLDIENSAVTTIWADGVAGCGALSEIKVPATLTEIKAGAFAGTVIEELDLSATGVTTLNDIFQGTEDDPYASLTSFKFPAAGFTTISGTGATTDGVFRYCTSLKEIEIPATITGTGFPPIGIPDYTFYYSAIETVNYQPTHPKSATIFGSKAFIGCKPFVKINTNSNYFALSTVEPTNATFGLAEDLQVTTVKDNGTSGKFFGKICAPLYMKISKEDLGDAKLYSVYTDDGIAYFQSLKVNKGYYYIHEGQHAIVKTNEETTINFEIGSLADPSSVQEDAIFSFDKDAQTADFQAGTATPSKPGFGPSYDGTFNAGTDYIYALTNSTKNGGFGFTFYKGTTLPAGAFFLLSTKNPNAAGRLQEVWLDEDGNVESEATAINKIQSKTEDGAIYNLQGVRVNAAKKGIYIQNGKKFIMK